jgi:flagellar secretion chaperone FliS
LLDVLDMEQGELSERLEAIYLFCLRHLQQSRFDRDANKLDEVSNLLGELREAWATIAGQ